MSNINKFKLFLEKSFKTPNPGHSAHEMMSPMQGQVPFRTFKPKKDAKDSAVILLLSQSDDEIQILLTLRSNSLNNHSGQISFPGGKVEIGESITNTALRECEEETGIEPKDIEIIGRLSPLFVPPSNSVIHPVVGLIDSGNINLKLNPYEVDEAFFVSLNELLDESNMKIEEWDLNGSKINVPFWDIHRTTPLWGATAMILKEFLVISKPYFSETDKLL